MQISAITTTFSISERRKLINAKNSPFAEDFDFSKYLNGEISPSNTSKFRQDTINRLMDEILSQYLGIDDSEDSLGGLSGDKKSPKRALNKDDAISVNAILNDNLKGDIDEYKVEEVSYDQTGISKISIGGVEFKRSTNKNDPANLFIGPNGKRYIYSKNVLTEVSKTEDINEKDMTGVRVLVEGEIFVITDGVLGKDINMKNLETGKAFETASYLGEFNKYEKDEEDKVSSIKVKVYEIGTQEYNYENGVFTKRSSNLEVGGNIKVATETIKDNKLKTTYSNLGATVVKFDADQLVIKVWDETKEDYIEQIYYKLKPSDVNEEGLRTDMNFYRYNDGEKTNYYVLEGNSLIVIKNINNPKYKFIYQETQELYDVKLTTTRGSIYKKGDRIYNESGIDVTDNPLYYAEFKLVWFGEQYDKTQDLDPDSSVKKSATELRGGHINIDINKKATTGFSGLTIKSDQNIYKGNDGRLFKFAQGVFTEIDNQTAAIYVLDAYKATKLGELTISGTAYQIGEQIYGVKDGLLTTDFDKKNATGSGDIQWNLFATKYWSDWELYHAKAFAHNNIMYLVPLASGNNDYELAVKATEPRLEDSTYGEKYGAYGFGAGNSANSWRRDASWAKTHGGDRHTFNSVAKTRINKDGGIDKVANENNAYVACGNDDITV